MVQCMGCNVLTGLEPTYDEDKYKPLLLRRNCYSYGVNSQNPVPIGTKATPGLRAGIITPLDLSSCNDVMARAIADNPDKMYPVKPCEPCKRGWYRVALGLDKHAADFHWYRAHGGFKHRVKPGDTYSGLARFYGIDPHQLWEENSRRPRLRIGQTIVVKVKGWSAKRGLTGTTITDSCGKFLKDPRKAAAEGCMDYGGLNYSVSCKDVCVKEGGLTTI